MQPIKSLGRAFLVSLALSAVVSGSAFAALPNILPAGSEAAPLTGNSTSGESVIGSGLVSLTSPKSTGSLSMTSEKNGAYDLLIIGVKNSLGQQCTSLEGKEAGSILFKNVVNHRWRTVNGVTVILVLLGKGHEVHFTCGTSLTILKGCVAGVVSEPYNEAKESATVTFATKEGDNEVIKVENEANTGTENCELLASENEGSFKLTSLKSTETFSEFKKSGAGVKVTIMTK
jgi:hypothetical protein